MTAVSRPTPEVVRASNSTGLFARLNGRKLLGAVPAYLMLLLLSSFILLPLSWMLTTALRPDNTPVFTIPTEWFPTEHWRWENFSRALFDPTRPFFIYARNTMFIVVFNIVGTVFSCSLAGYALARLRFRGSGILFNLIVLTMLIPGPITMVPQFLLFHKLGWYGSYLPLIVPAFGGNAFFIFLIRQYMKTFPRELEDAARIDGCSYWGVYRHIMLPLSKPVLAVVVVFVFLGSWNDLLGPLLYLNDNSKFTLSVGLSSFVARNGTPWNILMAANLITMIPPVIIYFFAQDKLVGGIASVGLKG